MRVCDQIQCPAFPCPDVRHDAFHVPARDIDPSRVRVVLIAEAVPGDPADGFDGAPDSLFARTTILSFVAAGFDVACLDDVRRLGIHVTTAVKCAKTSSSLPKAAIRECSILLERELALFPETTALLLMGDVAIRALNEIARRSGEPQPIPNIPTYKIRGGEFSFRGRRVFPSYLQAGQSFFIERGKQRVIAADIRAALLQAGISPAEPARKPALSGTSG